MKTKRTLLAAVAIAAIGVVIAGCTGSPGTEKSTASGDGPVRGGTLTIGQVTPIQNTDPYPYTGTTIPWRRQVFNTLVGFQGGKPTPQLATSWQISSDSEKITLHLRKGVKFSNGKPFTAQDAKWSIDFAKDPANSSQDGQQLAKATVTAVDTTTLELAFPTPTPQAMSVLSDVEMMWSGSDVQKHAIGTGPFMISKLTPGIEMDLAKNPHYWKSGEPYLDKVAIKVIPNADSLVVDLQSGSTDMIISPPLNKVASLRSSGYQVVATPGPGNYDFLFNTTSAPFNNLKVREAFNDALNRSQFSTVATSGVSKPTCQMFPPSSEAYTKTLETCSFDLKKAKQLIEESGIKTPIHTELAVPVVLPAMTLFAPIYQADLAKIGVDAKIVTLTQSQWTNYAINGGVPGVMGHSYSFGSLDPGVLMTANPFDVTRNAEGYSSTEYTNLVEKAAATPAGPARARAYQAVSKFVKEAAFILPVANNPGLFILNKDVHGLKVNVLAMPELATVWKG